MKKEEYASHVFNAVLRDLIALATAADTPPGIQYTVLRAWVVAYEEMWEKLGVPATATADLQGKSCELAKMILEDLERNGAPPFRGKFPDEIPDPPEGEP